MIKNCMHLFDLWRRGNIIYGLKNLLYILIMNHLSILEVKVILTVDMLSGLNLLNLFHTSSKTRKGRIMLLLMLCLDVIPCCLNLIVVYLGLNRLRDNMLVMLILNILL